MMADFQLTSTHRGLFEEQGYLRLRQAVPLAQLRPVQARIAEELGRHGVTVAGRGFTRAIYSLPVFQQIGKVSQWVNIPDLERAVIPRHLEDAVCALTTSRLTSRQSQLLLSPPKQGDWRLDGLNWHTDVPAGKAQLPGIQVFVALHDVLERAGATLILAGSHLCTRDPHTHARVRDAIRQGKAGDAALRELNLSIVELTGKAGDVYLMDMRVLHTPSINASSKIRAVATVRYFFE